MAETVYLLLGSNVGDRENYLAEANLLVSELDGFEVVACSSVYLSEAIGMAPNTPPFMNQAVKGEYLYTPHQLLHEVEMIESKLGRTNKGQLQPRTIDVDILLFGDRVVESDVLSIPHVRLLERPFALVPLAEIDAGLVHPVTKRLLTDYVKPKDRDSVVLYKEHVPRNQ